MSCPSCNYDNPADALSCMKCGTKVERRCSSCDTVNPADANFCRKCGGALGAAATASSPGPAAAAKTPRIEVTHERPTAEGLEGERKTVTALFADIKGSTELMEELDPEAARAIIDPALKLMIDAAHRYDGYVVQSTGDGIFALFGAPVAHEDVTMRRSASDAVSLELTQAGQGPIPVAGMSQVPAVLEAAKTLFTLKATGTAGTVENADSKHVTAFALPPIICEFSGSITTKHNGRLSLQLTWSTKGAAAVSISGNRSPVDRSGSLTITPTRKKPHSLFSSPSS